MSEPLSDLDGESMEHTEPKLAIVGGAQGDGSAESRKHRYPDYDFDIEERKFVDGVLEVTNHQRLRIAARTLAENVPGFDYLANSNERKRILEKRNAYLKERVVVGIDGSRQRNTKGQLVDTDSAIDTVFYGMAEINHPTAQLIGHIADKYEDKLRPVDLHWLYSQLVVLTGWEELRQVYDHQLATSEQTQ